MNKLYTNEIKIKVASAFRYPPNDFIISLDNP